MKKNVGVISHNEVSRDFFVPVATGITIFAFSGRRPTVTASLKGEYALVG